MYKNTFLIFSIIAQNNKFTEIVYITTTLCCIYISNFYFLRSVYLWINLLLMVIF
nr:MAG TPA: hypothetical protein [Inoviridae sp.]